MSTAPKLKENPIFRKIMFEVTSKVAKISGNKFGPRQLPMVEARIQRRMLEMKLPDPQDYWEYWQNHQQSEIDAFVSLLTTHHTFFFREFTHFRQLEKLLPSLCHMAKERGDNHLKIWSSACSRGQEVYSIAMFLNYHLKNYPQIKYSILGTDVDPQSVKFAQNGVYPRRELKEIPQHYLSGNWSRGTGAISEFVRANDSIRKSCAFSTLNLLSIPRDMSHFDVIFCRNVLIYFEDRQVELITKSLVAHLQDKGILFTGVSESLGHLKLGIYSIGTSSYQKGRKFEVVSSTTQAQPSASLPQPALTTSSKADPQKKLRVVCVDDSGPILTLLKKILSMSEDFEVVGTAPNGVVAHEVIEREKPDLVTLDIHMPEMDGITYLSKYFNKLHPPVVMVSSASRDDCDTAQRALELGAADFIEKPAMTNLSKVAEEIHTKLLVAHSLRNAGAPIGPSIDQQFSKKLVIKKPENAFHLMVASISQLEKVTHCIGEIGTHQPPIVVCLEGNHSVLPVVIKRISEKTSLVVRELTLGSEELEPNTIYVLDHKTSYHTFLQTHKSKTASLLVFGQVSSEMASSLMEWPQSQLLLEDNDKQSCKQLKDVASDLVPFTSFSYLSTKFISEKESS